MISRRFNTLCNEKALDAYIVWEGAKSYDRLNIPPLRLSTLNCDIGDFNPHISKTDISKIRKKCKEFLFGTNWIHNSINDSKWMEHREIKVYVVYDDLKDYSWRLDSSWDIKTFEKIKIEAQIVLNWDGIVNTEVSNKPLLYKLLHKVDGLTSCPYCSEAIWENLNRIQEKFGAEYNCCSKCIKNGNDEFSCWEDWEECRLGLGAELIATNDEEEYNLLKKKCLKNWYIEGLHFEKFDSQGIVLNFE